MNHLIALHQWIVVRLDPLPGGKTNKIPVNSVTLQPCNAHEPQNWTTHDTARTVAAALGPAYTVGFVLTASDDLFCLDIDGCATPTGWSPLALELINALPGCMVEVSQSGRGLHIWGRYPNPPAHASKRVDLGIELYTEKRFIAIGTGQVGQIAPLCPTLPMVVATWFPPRSTGPADTHGDGPRADWCGPADDAELLRRALRSTSAGAAFGGKATFADLWDRNLPVLARHYPGDGEGGVDWSSVDAAAAQHLAFWTGCDQGRMVRLLMGSPLHRPKYEREDYLPRTVASACGMQREVLQDKPLVSPLQPPASTPVAAAAAAVGAAPQAPASNQALMAAREGSGFLTAEQQAQLFAGCVYILDLHRVLVPGGKLLKPDQFRALFGGYSFAMDRANERVSRNAFEAFTESQQLRCPTADGTAFDPRLPYGTIIESEGRRRANMWWPAQVRRVAGDASPFLRHMQLLFPSEADRKFLLYWMATVVQRPGYKSQWMPLLVGTEGNGKSLFSRCLAYAVGNRYTHWPDASKLGGTFNGWLYGKTLICIEDLMIADSIEVWEKLKPMITGESLEIEGKGIDQRTDEVCANFIANSNHKNAIRATLNDRRVCHLWCAQQNAGALISDGLDEAYMSGLYDWLKNRDGFAIVAEFLATLEIPEQYGLKWFMGRAPKTSHHADAIEASRGPIEQEVLEAIERDDLGFRGGWVSSQALDKLLERMGPRYRVAPNKRREILQNLGYDWHPALPDGRVNNPVLPDGAKVKLFVRNDHAARLMTRPSDVAAAYSQAQGLPGAGR